MVYLYQYNKKNTLVRIPLVSWMWWWAQEATQMINLYGTKYHTHTQIQEKNDWEIWIRSVYCINFKKKNGNIILHS